jgi:hypothetical protein
MSNNFRNTDLLQPQNAHFDILEPDRCGDLDHRAQDICYYSGRASLDEEAEIHGVPGEDRHVCAADVSEFVVGQGDLRVEGLEAAAPLDRVVVGFDAEGQQPSLRRLV